MGLIPFHNLNKFNFTLLIFRLIINYQNVAVCKLITYSIRSDRIKAKPNRNRNDYDYYSVGDSTNKKVSVLLFDHS